MDYQPNGPLDPLAAQVAAFFAADPVWAARAERPLAETRAALRAATPVTGEPAMATEELAVPADGRAIPLRVYHPVPVPPAIILWVHGGGFALGSVDESDGFARRLAAATGCTIVSVDYRLAPEHPFPAGLDDVAAALRFACAHRPALAGAGVPVIAAGESAGANLATVATRRLHAAGEGPVAAQILAYPCTDDDRAPSLHAFRPPFLDGEDVRFFLRHYAPDPEARSGPDVAPLRAPGLALLPPTLFLTAEHDVVTEQAEDYARALAAVGVAVRTRRYAGMIHGFLTLEPFLPGAAGEALEEIAAFTRNVAGGAESAGHAVL